MYFLEKRNLRFHLEIPNFEEIGSTPRILGFWDFGPIFEADFGRFCLLERHSSQTGCQISGVLAFGQASKTMNSGRFQSNGISVCHFWTGIFRFQPVWTKVQFGLFFVGSSCLLFFK